MTTTTHFEKVVKDAGTDKEIGVDVGRTNFAGEGPQMYLKLGDSEVILSKDDAKAFCEAVAEVGSYFGFQE